MSTPQKSEGGGPSIKLKVRALTPPPASSSTSPPKSKKRRFVPPPSIQDNEAEASNLRLFHQKSHLSFFLHSPTPSVEPEWYAQGQTTLYLADTTTATTPTTTTTTTSNDSKAIQLALHLRGSCQVTNVQVEGISESNYSALVPFQSAHLHMDPLQKVLLKPAASYTMDDVISKTRRHEADSQSSRGAAGMTNAIRAASIASNLGELRISTSCKPLPKERKPLDEHKLIECWRRDLALPYADGAAATRLKEQLASREDPRKQARIDLVAKAMGKVRSALKVTIHYKILLGGNIQHFGGIHAMTSQQTPHIYTTAGVFGDHEGPRSWIPTCDSASTMHRSSHDITIHLTAPMRNGLTVVGFGEDYGVTETFLHRRPTSETPDVDIQKELGFHHVKMVHQVATPHSEPNSPHLIPPDLSSNVLPIDSLLATTIWTSGSWLPVPSRALGFAIGPFRVIEDPEFFHLLEDDASEEAKQLRAEMEEARRNGEGIRQHYFAPVFARKFIHAQANAKFLPNTEFKFAPLTQRQRDLIEGMDRSVLIATSGVTHRALSLMRDILALPTFRTVSYSQIWIPGAVHGGSTAGALHCCPEVLVNPFLGGSIMDARLLPPVGHRLPFHHGGRVLQFLQARCAIRAWITSAIPLGGKDDVGQGYIHTLFESLVMSLYERGHGAYGEGGAKDSLFHTKRFSSGSGLNSNSLDFFPVQNIEDTDLDVAGSIVGAVPVEDRNNDQLWRSASNGTESHTSAMDEFAIRQLLCKDAVHTMERATDKGRNIPMPSSGWLGSHLSLSFLSSNATSSTELGCGALELVHPVGGLPYRALKGDLLRRIVEGRAGIANFIRLVRAAFVAAHLDDTGHEELRYSPEKRAKTPEKEKTSSAGVGAPENEDDGMPKPRFIVCVNEILKKRGLTHTLFTRALQNLAGRVREAQLLGTLVDVERNSTDPRTNYPFVDPEGFPNSYVRGASELYLKVGVHVEPARDGPGGSGVSKGIQLQMYAEPVIPAGGVSFGGPITVRVVENEGAFREFVKDVNTDGSRRDWGSLFLHAKPVTLPKAQTAASGIIETAGSNVKDPSKASSSAVIASLGSFTESQLHRGGYQAIELIRLTNLTPLLWVRVDPTSMYGGRTSVFQPDACLAEMLFHDGDAGAQVEAMRALAERPVRIQGSVKVTTIYDVNISELPVRVLGDCLRGSPALHSSLPHTPAVRAQAALSIAQWQNNKAPSTKNSIGAKHWVGLHLLIQYFKERFFNNGMVLPVKMNRVVLKKNMDGSSQPSGNPDGAAPTVKATEDVYEYLDSFVDEQDRAAVLEEVDEVEVEEDEEYRVRSAVLTAIASVRAKDGMTPAVAIEFLETVLDAVDAEMIGNLVSPDEEVFLGKKRRKLKKEEEEDLEEKDDLNDGMIPSMPYASSMLVADALLALCHINISPAVITDPVTGKPVQSTASHPVSKLMETSRRWLDWELYREGTRAEVELESMSGLSGVCYDSIASCAITALSSLAILRQSTTDQQAAAGKKREPSQGSGAEDSSQLKQEEAASADFYIKIFDSKPRRSDVTRAACAQAIACICCAADRFERNTTQPTGLLLALEFMLERILDKSTSPGLRQTLAQLMLDACTGKISSMQRVGVIAEKNNLVTAAARFLNGPLGSSHGGDNGGAAVTTVNSASYPAAAAVNDGARSGLRLITRAGRDTDYGDALTVRIAGFATTLWRTINGEPIKFGDSVPGHTDGSLGVCAYDGQLRCTLLCLWQWVWAKNCFAIMRVQAWKSIEGTQHYKDIGANLVMKTSEEEKEAANAEEEALTGIRNLVNMEINRQSWRGDMAFKAYEFSKNNKSVDASAAEQGIGQPLPPIERDSSFSAGGWIASAAQQRRKLALDGGMAVTKLRLRKSGDY